MRVLFLVALLSASGSAPPMTEPYLQKLNDACRSLGGVRELRYGPSAVHAECREGLKITVYPSAARDGIDEPF
jgi:hypothetical protein